MDYEKFFADRLAQLRMDVGVSAREMSLSMGQSPGYINKIENRQNFPSMPGFFSICDYLDVSPTAFFDLNTTAPRELNNVEEKLKLLSDSKLKAVEVMVDALLAED